jgi:predicted molibdopterin-dependent oxidoreductase YjgC
MHRILNHPILGPLSPKGGMHLEFEGRILEAREGESVAAALLANGIKVFRYTAKTQSPRSVYCALGRCTDCVMVVDGVPNVRTCVTIVRNGMKIQRQEGLGGIGMARV